MNFLVYSIVYPFLWIISRLPFRLLYMFSDLIFVFLFHVVRYRRKTVYENLKLALPHLSDSEHKRIEKEFYRHMCDMFLEMIKTLGITAEEMKNRFTFTNMEVVHEFEKKGKSIILMCAHYASWEWMIIMGRFINIKGFGIYKKVKNPYFDKLVRDIRSKFDATLIDTKSTVKQVTENQQNGRSEERRVGKEWRSRWWTNNYKKEDRWL